MDDRRELVSDVRDRTVRPLGKRDLLALLVDPHVALREPERELEARVADRTRERGTNTAGAHAPEFDDEVPDGSTRPPREHEPEERGRARTRAARALDRSSRGSTSAALVTSV